MKLGFRFLGFFLFLEKIWEGVLSNPRSNQCLVAYVKCERVSEILGLDPDLVSQANLTEMVPFQEPKPCVHCALLVCEAARVRVLNYA